MEIADKTARGTAQTAYDKANEAESIAKGSNQALAYATYEKMVEVLNAMESDILRVGQNIYIGTVGVPDLWVYAVEEAKSEYTYESDDAMVAEIETNTALQIGYYKVAFLEGQKVDLSNVLYVMSFDSSTGTLNTKSADYEG